MKTKIHLIGALAISSLLISCGGIKSLDRNGAEILRGIAPNALGASTDFLRGSPVSLASPGGVIEQLARLNPLSSNARTISLSQLNFFSSSLQPMSARTLADTANCKPNDTADDDGDDILKDVDCNIDITTQGTRYIGRIRIKDQDDDNGFSGYLVDVDYVLKIQGQLDTKLRLFAEVTEPTNSNQPYQVKQIFAVEAPVNNELSGLKYENTVKYTPATTTSFDAGIMDIAAKLEFFAGADRYAVNLNADLEIDLARCGDAITDGSAEFSEGTKKLTWTVTGCGTGDWTENGFN